MEIRGFTIKYSKWKAKKYRDEEISRHKKVNDLQAKAKNNPHNRNIVFGLQRARSRLKKYVEENQRHNSNKQSEMARRRRTQHKVSLQLRKTPSWYQRAIVTIKRMCVLDYLHFLLTNRNLNTITSARICLEFHVPFENIHPPGFEFLQLQRIFIMYMLCEGLVRLTFSHLASTSAAIWSFRTSSFNLFFQVDQLQVSFVSNRFENLLSTTSHFSTVFNSKHKIYRLNLSWLTKQFFNIGIAIFTRLIRSLKYVPLDKKSNCCACAEGRQMPFKSVSKLKVEENCYIEDQFEILEEEKKIYESLYCSTNINPEFSKTRHVLTQKTYPHYRRKEVLWRSSKRRRMHKCSQGFRQWENPVHWWSAGRILPILQFSPTSVMIY